MRSKFLPELLNFTRAKRSVVPMDPDDFRKLRKAAGLTQGQMAERIGVSRLTINNWEGAKFRIPDDILDTLAEKGLGVPAVKPKDSAFARLTAKTYGEMRGHMTHSDILAFWQRKGFTPSPEACQLIASAFPDILNPKKDD